MTKPTKLSLALIAHLEACGYQVTKRKSKRTKERPALNCLGKPMSASFDPNWKRRRSRLRLRAFVSRMGMQ